MNLSDSDVGGDVNFLRYSDSDSVRPHPLNQDNNLNSAICSANPKPNNVSSCDKTDRVTCYQPISRAFPVQLAFCVASIVDPVLPESLYFAEKRLW